MVSYVRIYLWQAKSETDKYGNYYLFTQLIYRDEMQGQPLSTRYETKGESHIKTTCVVINIQLEIAYKWLSVCPRV